MLLGADDAERASPARPVASLPEVAVPNGGDDASVDEAIAGATKLPGLIGRIETVFVDEGESLVEIAHAHRVGFESLMRLNPEVDPWIPAAGTVVWLPTRSILPDVDPDGLVINVPEMRLYDFTVEPVETFAVAVGDAQDPSPIGEFRIGARRTDPAWHVPSSIREEKPWLPAIVPPGDDNPLGKHWMTIGRTSYGIHGTNMRWSIGRTSTHGCIRLYEDQIARLYERTPSGTRIRLLYEPIKWGVEDDRLSVRLFVEVHPDIYERAPVRLGPALEVPRALGLLDHVDLEGVIHALREQRGIPVEVGRIPRPQPASGPAATSRPTS